MEILENLFTYYNYKAEDVFVLMNSVKNKENY